MSKKILSQLVLAALVTLASTSVFADTHCTVMTDEGNFYGEGYDSGSALADARNSCIQQINNGQECTYAPFSCNDDYNPYPPAPPVQQSTCMVTLRNGDVFNGRGYDVGSALADARNQCIAEEGNSAVCMSAPFSCRQ